jgi:transposase
MYKKLSDIMATLPKERQEKIIARANQLIRDLQIKNIPKTCGFPPTRE